MIQPIYLKTALLSRTGTIAPLTVVTTLQVILTSAMTVMLLQVLLRAIVVAQAGTLLLLLSVALVLFHPNVAEYLGGVAARSSLPPRRNPILLTEIGIPFKMLVLTVAGLPLHLRISKTRSPALVNVSECKNTLMKHNRMILALKMNILLIGLPRLTGGVPGKTECKICMNQQTITPFTVRSSASYNAIRPDVL